MHLPRGLLLRPLIFWFAEFPTTEKQRAKPESFQVLDRTKVLHGPRTQTYGEPRFYMVLEPKPTGKLDTLAAKC